MKSLTWLNPALRLCASAAVLAVVALPVRAQGVAQPGTAGAITPAPSPYQMVHAESGTKAVKRNGRMYFEDPRSTFRVGDDHQIMVEFEWAGPVGAHKFVGMWKDPTGQVVVVSNFQFTPVASPYSGFFTLLLGDTAPTGVWTIDATIDGQTAGSYSFEVVGSGAAVPKSAPERVPLDTKDLYSRMQTASVFIEKVDSAGVTIGRGSGFFIGPSRILTAFESIDGASNLRIILPDGQTITSNEVLAWNRWQDWAVLKVGANETNFLKLAAAKSWSVGDHCFALGSSAGGRTILSGRILGQSDQPRFGKRMTISIVAAPDEIGGPVVNEFGDVIGIIGGNVLPGVAFTNGNQDTGMPGLMPVTFSAPGLTVPVDIVDVPSANLAPTTLSALFANGVFFPPLTEHDRIGFAALTSQVERKNGPAWPQGIRTEFSLSQQTMSVFVNWKAKGKEKFKGIADAHFFDLDNKEIAHTPPLKVNIHGGNIDSTYWTFKLNVFAPGAYRADIDLDGAPAWRQFFRVTQ